MSDPASQITRAASLVPTEILDELPVEDGIEAHGIETFVHWKNDGNQP